jgi:hypothetical protein
VCHFVSVATKLFFRVNFKLGASLFLLLSNDCSQFDRPSYIPLISAYPPPPVVPNLTPLYIFISFRPPTPIIAKTLGWRVKGSFPGVRLDRHTYKQHFPKFGYSRKLQENPINTMTRIYVSMGYISPIPGLFGSCKLHVCTIPPHVADHPFV